MANSEVACSDLADHTPLGARLARCSFTAAKAEMPAPPTANPVTPGLATTGLATRAGCDRTHVEIDHRVTWAESRHTRLDELDGLCDHHHDLKTYDGWALIDGTGKRPMVAPDEPRHPNNSPPTDRAGPSPPAHQHHRPADATLFDDSAA